MHIDSERGRVHALQSSIKALDSDAELAPARVAMDVTEVLLVAQVQPKWSLNRVLVMSYQGPQ